MLHELMALGPTGCLGPGFIPMIHGMQVVCTFLSKWDPYYIFDQCCLKSKHLARMLQWMFRQWHYVYIVSLYMIGLEQSLKCWQQIIQTSTRFSFVFWLQNITSLHNTRVAPSHPSLLSPHCCSSVWSGLLISAPCLTISGMSHCVLPLPYIIIHWVLLIGHTPSQCNDPGIKNKLHFKC